MTIGSIGGNFTLLQSYLSSGLSLNKYVSSLVEQKKDSFSINSSFNQSLGSSYFNESRIQQLEAVGNKAIDIQSQINRMASLTQYSSNAGKTASYSNENVLSASVSKNAAVLNNTTTNINVTQLASGQQNRSADLDANENSFGDQFSISITDNAGRTSQFSVDLTEEDDNRTAMRAMVNEINASNIGVRATLTEDTENGTISMQISSERTGKEDGRFTVTDESAAELGNVSEASRNAEYTVDGSAFSSQSNEVRILDGVSATLNQTGSTQITYEADFSPAIGAVQQFLDTFNGLVDAASGTSVERQLTSIVNNNFRGLGYSGIDIDSSGRLSISNPDKLSESISNNSFARNFQGVNSIGHMMYDVSSNAHSTVYNTMIQESFNDLMSSLMSNVNATNNPMNNAGLASYGDWQTGTSFYSGLIFSIWV